MESSNRWRKFKSFNWFQTHEIQLNDLATACRSVKLPDNVINHIAQVQNKIGSHIDYYHVYNQDPFSIYMIYGVVLRTQNTLLFSFIYGRAQAKISVNQCRNNQIKVIRMANPDKCHEIHKNMINKRGDIRNNIQKISNEVFIGKFIQFLQNRLSGLDF